MVGLFVELELFVEVEVEPFTLEKKVLFEMDPVVSPELLEDVYSKLVTAR